MDKEYKDPIELDLTKPRLAAFKQRWKVHQDTVYWVDIRLAQRKGIEVLSNKIERSHPLRYTPSLLYLHSNCEEIIYQKVYVSPPTISYKDNWTKQ